MWTDDVERALAPDYLGDVATRPIEEIRVMRAECRSIEDKVSYVRRLAQGHLDIVSADLRRRAEGGSPLDLSSMVDRLAEILSDNVRGPGPGRLPSSAFAPDDDDLTTELDSVAPAGALAALEELSDAEVAALAERLATFEREVSDRRRALFGRIDALGAELTRRYKSGEATVGPVLG